MGTQSHVTEEVKDAVLHWLDGLRHAPGLYRYSRSAFRPYSAESSAQAVGLLFELGELDKMPPDRTEQHVRAIQSFQGDSQGAGRDQVNTGGSDRTNVL